MTEDEVDLELEVIKTPWGDLPLVESLGKALDIIYTNLLKKITESEKRILKKIGGLESNKKQTKEIGKLVKKIDQISNRLDQMDSRLSKIESKFEKGKIEIAEKLITNLKEDIGELSVSLIEIRDTLRENRKLAEESKKIAKEARNRTKKLAKILLKIASGERLGTMERKRLEEQA